jgi:hypothetical protein
MVRIHKILCSADSFTAAQKHVYGFFDKTMLLHYDCVKIIPELSLPVSDTCFWPEIASAIEQNKSVLTNYIEELKETGCLAVDDFTTLSHGYPSKVLHLLAHLLDGFIGIDSVFYNLLEDSHWFSDKLKNDILAAPGHYWLVHVEGHFNSESKASLIHL